MKKRYWILLIAATLALVYYFLFITSETRADTIANKRFFKHFTKIQVTKDVRNIYCHSDETGFDASYRMVFNCEPHTANKIAKKTGA